MKRSLATLLCIVTLSATVVAQRPDADRRALPQTGDSILITQLPDVLAQLQQTKKKFKDLGISSGPDDLINVSGEGKKYEVSFRSEGEDGEVYFTKLQDFAVHNGYDIKITESPDPKNPSQPVQLPILTFKVKEAEQAYELIRAIMINVFRHKKNDHYQLIMPG